MLEIHTACNFETNGIKYIKPYDDSNDLLPVYCNNGWTILNPALNYEQYQLFFSSMYKYDQTFVGPALEDFKTWREWYLPKIEDKSDYKFRISNDCSSECVDSTNFFF